MWFWIILGVVIVVGLAMAGLYDRRARGRRGRVHSAAEMEREIAKRGRFDGLP